MNRTFKILFNNYFNFIGFPFGAGLVSLLFNKPIDAGLLIGFALGTIYSFFSFRYTYIDKIWIENDKLHIESINRFLQKKSCQFEMEKISNIKIYYIKWYRETGRMEFNIYDEHKSYKFFKTEEQMVVQQQFKES